MSDKKVSRSGLALGAMVVGIASVPVTAFVSAVLGIAMMAAPIFMIYKAS